MKKTIFVFLLALLAFFSVPGMIVFAEETEEIEVVETETSIIEKNQADNIDAKEWLKSEFLPQAASALILFATMWITTRPQAMSQKTLAKQMIFYAQSLGVSKEITEKQVSDILVKYGDLKDRFEESVKLIEKYKDDIDGLLYVNRKLLEAVELGFGNNTELVKKGTAAVICKIVEEAKEEYASEVTEDVEGRKEA